MCFSSNQTLDLNWDRNSNRFRLAQFLHDVLQQLGKKYDCLMLYEGKQTKLKRWSGICQNTGDVFDNDDEKCNVQNSIMQPVISVLAK